MIKLGKKDNFIIIGAFRYALGRMTYVVKDTTDWLKEHWLEIDYNTKKLIIYELGEEIIRDERYRNANVTHKPLGMDCDREEWLRLYQFIVAGEEKVEEESINS